MREAAAEHGIEVIPGVEISTWADVDLHLLAYGVPTGPSAVSGLLDGARSARRHRAERMVERLAELGKPITLESVLAQAGVGAIGRPHVARALLAAGHVATNREAFDKYLGDGKPACVEKPRIDPAEAIARIHAAGGVAVAAHPVIYGGPAFYDFLVEADLDGVEVKHPLHGRKAEKVFDEYARSHGLVRTGGSDFHGRGSGIEVGAVSVPDEWLDDLKERIATRRAAAAGTTGDGPASPPGRESGEE